MKTQRCFKLLLTLVATGVFVQAGAQAQTYVLQPPASTIPDTLFGLHIHHLTQGAQRLTPWPSIPFGTWRLWDAYAVWANLEPQKGKWDLGNVDNYISLAEKHHVQVLMPLGMPPPWASERPKEAPSFRPGSAAPPKSMNDWEDYVRTLATHFRGNIRYWELWNEPNDKVFYSGSVSHMVDLAKAAERILKEVDPTNELVCPAATSASGPPWLSSFLSAGGGNYCDVIGYHFYVTPKPPEALVPLAQKVHQIMAQNGVANKPLWCTEIGWYIQDKAGNVRSPSAYWSVIPSAEAQGYVARTYVLAWASGISRLYWYDWDSNVMGLAEPGFTERKSAAYAYVVTEKWLIGARMVSCDSDGSGTWICHITRDGGFNGYIVWNDRGEKGFAIPKAWNVQNYQDIAGNVHALNGQKSIGVGPLPTLLENQLP